MNDQPPLSIGMCAQLACVLDVVSFKPGNVNLLSSKHDMNFVDFLLSAAAIAPVMERAPFCSIGQTILECIRETRRVTEANTNLGIVLLLAPLASVPPNKDLRGGLMRGLIRTTVDDAKAAYEAIRSAKPGGLGNVSAQDVSDEPTVSLREAMAMAADRDLIAKQYVNDFEQVFEGASLLRHHLTDGKTALQLAVQRTFLQLLAKYTDSLIARKFGLGVAKEVSCRANEVVQSNFDNWEVHLMDYWLRSGCSERLRHGLPKAEEYLPPKVADSPNPGTTADLVTASLFVALRAGIIQLPFDPPVRAHTLDF